MLEVLVNAVDLAGDGEFVRGRVVFGTVKDFVVVLYASKTGDLDLGDVLEKTYSQLGLCDYKSTH